eukprot:361612-Chlamydomonas_euryale.AAC.15
MALEEKFDLQMDEEGESSGRPGLCLVVHTCLPPSWHSGRMPPSGHTPALYPADAAPSLHACMAPNPRLNQSLDVQRPQPIYHACSPNVAQAYIHMHAGSCRCAGIAACMQACAPAWWRAAMHACMQEERVAVCPLRPACFLT